MSDEYEAVLGPFSIDFGFGRVAVCGFSDKEGAGIRFSDCGDTHSVGDKWPHGKPNPHTPEKGEVYLHFANVESLDVVLDALQEVRQGLIAKKR